MRVGGHGNQDWFGDSIAQKHDSEQIYQEFIVFVYCFSFSIWTITEFYDYTSAHDFNGFEIKTIKMWLWRHVKFRLSALFEKFQLFFCRVPPFSAAQKYFDNWLTSIQKENSKSIIRIVNALGVANSTLLSILKTKECTGELNNQSLEDQRRQLNWMIAKINFLGKKDKPLKTSREVSTSQEKVGTVYQKPNQKHSKTRRPD